MPAVDFTSPPGSGPASVTPRCSGWSIGLRQQAVRVDHHRHVRRLHRDLHVVEVDLGEVGRARASPTRPAPRAWRRRSCSAMSGSSDPAFTPMRIGMPRSFASRATSLDVLGLADVAGVEAQALHAGFHRGERELVLEVDVGDDRHRRAGHDLREPLGGRLLVAGAAHDVAARGGERVDLRERAVDVGRLGGGHRLHRHRRVAADRDRRRRGSGG